MTYESNQDWATTMARISALTLQGDYQLKTWRHEYRRSDTNDNQAEFERHLHDAMGYRADHANELEF